MYGHKLIKSITACIIIATFLGACSSTNQLPKGLFKTTWHLVVIGDSSLWGLGEAYARQIEQDNGVTVIFEDFALPALRAGDVLEALKTGSSSNMRLEELPDAVKEADFVIMFTNPLGSIDTDKPLSMDGCFGCSLPVACGPETYTKYVEDLKGIWQEILKLRGGKPTVLRATDIYNPLVSQWNDCRLAEACDACWTNMSNAARQAADAYQIPFLSRYDAFNGPEHTEDPREKGFIRSDGEHPTDEANQFTAGLLAKMGYAPTLVP
jgi:hypothetical protein